LGTVDPRDDIIDLACGAGFYTALLQQATQGVVYGVDIS